MKKLLDDVEWHGYPAPKETLQELVQRMIAQLPQCRKIHYSFMEMHPHPQERHAVNFYARLTWLFAGELKTAAAFERRWEHRKIGPQELFLSGTGGWDEPDLTGSNYQALAILFYSNCTRLVYSESQAGEIVKNPYYHTTHPTPQVGRRLLESLNGLLNEPQAERAPRTLAICRAILEQVLIDIRRENFSLSTSNDRLVTQIATYCQQCFHLPINVSNICDRLNLNRTYASKIFHEKTGGTIKDYLEALRLDKAKWLLECYDYPLEKLACQCGFSTANYFIRVFREKNGVTPKVWQHQIHLHSPQSGDAFPEPEDDN